jgi:hypothetical protein
MLLWFAWFVALGLAMMARRRMSVAPNPMLHPAAA